MLRLLQDLRLRVALLQLSRNQDFSNLAVVGAFRGKRCSRAAVIVLPPSTIRPARKFRQPQRQCERDPFHDENKASILDREQRLDHARRNPVERHGDPLLHEKREGRFAQPVVTIVA